MLRLSRVIASLFDAQHCSFANFHIDFSTPVYQPLRVTLNILQKMHLRVHENISPKTVDSASSFKATENVNPPRPTPHLTAARKYCLLTCWKILCGNRPTCVQTSQASLKYRTLYWPAYHHLPIYCHTYHNYSSLRFVIYKCLVCITTDRSVYVNTKASYR